MSDFLTRLVMHAGRALEVIRPRPLSRFEDPVRPSGASEEITFPVARQSRTPFVTPDDGTERARRTAPSARDSVFAPEHRTRASDPPTDRSAAQPPHPTVQVHPPSAMREPETGTGTSPETVRHETSHTITRIVEQAVRPETRPHTSVDDSIPARTASQAKAANRLAPLPPTQPRVPFVRPADVQASTRDARQVPAPPPPETPARSDLTVEITIGRVDVRAVMPPSPKVRESRTPKPELSLDDYLQGRGRRT